MKGVSFKSFSAREAVSWSARVSSALAFKEESLFGCPSPFEIAEEEEEKRVSGGLLFFQNKVQKECVLCFR